MGGGRPLAGGRRLDERPELRLERDGGPPLLQPDGLQPDRLVEPVAEYDHRQGCAIVGGYVGRNPDEPALYGGYVFGDDCSGNIWVLDAADPGVQQPVLLVGSGHMISSFGEDEAGRLYLTDLRSGELLRIVAGPLTAGLPDAKTGAGLLEPAPASSPGGIGYGMR